VDTPLKQRLIGAIVLVALAVIFLPMLVKGPAPDSGVANVPIAAPDAPADGQFETRELPLVAPAGGATGLQTGQAKPLQDAATLPEAVQLATQRAHVGDAVLLSPACASLDMFDNYAHRARVFCEAVQALAEDAGQTLEGGTA